MSSKFNPAVAQKLSVPQCKKPPDPLPDPAGGFPIRLLAAATWMDWGAPDYPHVSASFALDAAIPGSEYAGTSIPAGATLEIECTRTPDTNLWRIDLYIWDPIRQPELFSWLNITPDPLEPMELHPPPNIYVPGEDERHCVIIAP